VVNAGPTTRHPAPPKVGVVGAGLIGGSIVRRSLANGSAVWVVDPDDEVLASASQQGARPATIEELVAEVEVAFLCPPPRAVAEVWQTLLDADPPLGRAGPRLVAMDVASVKAPILDVITESGFVQEDAVLTLAHPMAGKEASGWAASDRTLFDGAPWVLMPPAGSTGGELWRAITSVEALGAVPCFMEPGFHDHFAGLTSHVAHALAFAFQAQVDALDPHGWRRFSGNSLRDLLRVASSDHALWTQILTDNHAELAPLLRDLADRLERFDPSTDIPVTPPQDPAPGEDAKLELSCGWDEPIDRIRDELLASGQQGLHLHEATCDDGSVRLRLGGPLASAT